MWLRRAAAVLLAVAIGIAGCGPTTARKPISMGIRNNALRTMVYHADTAFKPEERRWISFATDNIREQTAGLLQVIVVYDLNFDSVLSLTEHARDDMLVRAPADAPYVLYEDTATSRLMGVVAGVDLDNYSMVTPKQVFLVADRFKNSDVFIHVAMHEMLHAFGLRHVTDPDSIMYAMTVGSHPTLCMAEADAVELCRVNWCEADQLNYCK